MGSCRQCGTWGLFLGIFRKGICASCWRRLHFTVPRQRQILAESVALARNGKTLKTRCGRCDDALRILEEFVKLESIGALDLNPPGHVLQAEMRSLRTKMVDDEGFRIASAAIAKAASAKSKTSSVNVLTKALRDIDKLRVMARGDAYLVQLQTDIHSRIRTICAK